MTEQETLTWPPREALHLMPAKPFPWSVILAPVAVVVVGLIVAAVLLSLPDIARAFGFIPGQEQPPSSASLNSAPQTSSYSKGKLL